MYNITQEVYIQEYLAINLSTHHHITGRTRYAPAPAPAPGASPGPGPGPGSVGPGSDHPTPPSSRGLHTITFRLNVNIFCGIRLVHGFPPVYQTDRHG
jgi:hypothetical protein